MKRVVATAFVVALCACSGPVKERVKADLVKALPMESRIELLDAENGLFAAIDGVDEGRNDVEDAQQEGDQADDRIDEAKDQRKKAKKEGDANAESIAELAIVEAKARKDFLKVEVKILRGVLKVKEADLDVARGRYELSKAREVKRVNLDGAQKLKVEDFENQVAKLEERSKKFQDDVDAMRAGSDDQKKAWDDSRAELAKATGGAQGSAFVE